MVRRRLLLILILATVVGIAFPLPALADGNCDDLIRVISGCEPEVGGENTGGGTDLIGTVMDPGGTTVETSTEAGSSGVDPFPFDAYYDTNGRLIDSIIECTFALGCGWKYPGREVVEVEETEPITLVDIARFEAHSGQNVMEPEGWAVTGLHANFYSTVKRHIVEGELLGNPALVRYTPVAWHWNFGDGSSLDGDTAGASWDDLEQPEFSRTETSHVFDETGAREITLTIDFTAEYSFTGSEWVAIDGQVETAAEPIEAKVGTAKTVLVSGACSAGSNAPGC